MTLDGVGDGELEGVLPAAGEKVGLGLAAATGVTATSIEGDGAVEVGVRPQAESVTTQPTAAARAIRRNRAGPASTCCEA